jgi:hypothetical protein
MLERAGVSLTADVTAEADERVPGAWRSSFLQALPASN